MKDKTWTLIKEGDPGFVVWCALVDDLLREDPDAGIEMMADYVVGVLAKAGALDRLERTVAEQERVTVECRGYPDENALCTACGRDEDAHGRVASPGDEFHCDICGSDTHDALACDPLPVKGRVTTPCPRCQHAVLHTAQEGCAICSCDALVDWLGPVALRAAGQKPVACIHCGREQTHRVCAECFAALHPDDNCECEAGRSPSEVHRRCGGGEVGAHGGPDDRHCLICTDPACRYNQPDESTTPVLDLMAQAIGGSMLRTSPRKIAEAVLLALGSAGYRLTPPASSPTSERP